MKKLCITGLALTLGIGHYAVASSIESARKVIKRQVPQLADTVRLEVIPAAEGKDAFEVDQSNGKPVIRGNNAVSLVRESRPNILLICVDDLRPELGCYGVKDIKTPNIDRLASEGRLYRRHYAYAAACGPSRSTLLSGRRTVDWDIFKKERRLKEAPNTAFSIPTLFKRNGYTTVCVGKVSHKPGGVTDVAQKIHEVPFSWDRSYAPTGAWKEPWRAFFSYAHGHAENRLMLKREPPRYPYESADVADDGYADGLNAQAAIRELNQLKDKPFFLAVGFYKPHLPFNAPKKYWDLYDRGKLSQASQGKPPQNSFSKLNLHNSYEPTTHYKWDGKVVTEKQGRTLKHGYYAAVSYVDAQIGKVLDEIKRLGLDKNTAIVLWSDHGWHLGDYGIWGKATNYEIALRSPLIIKTPGLNKPGVPTKALAGSVDLFPTLADLCNLPKPTHLQGKSLLATIIDPEAPGKKAVIGSWNGGQTIRTERYRMITKAGKTELYDHQDDASESNNVAAQHPKVVAKLKQTLLSISRNKPNN